MSGQSLILISGWAHTASALDALAGRLSDSFRVVSTSTNELWAGSKTDSPHIDGLLSLLQRTGGKPVLAGWSMGGMLALEAAVRYPDAMSALVLISSTARFCSLDGELTGAPRARLRAMARALKRDRAGVLRGFFEETARPGEEPELDARVSAACAMDVRELAAGLNYLENFDVRRDLFRVSIPALAIHGKSDRIVPWQASSFLKSHLPNCCLVFDEESGHGLPIRKPDVTASEILRFIEREAAGGTPAATEST